MITFHDLDDARQPALLAASARHFGSGSYQADARYLRWLYDRNPASSGPRDCVVAVQNGDVVGCMHRLMLPMGGGRRLAALHNHFVDPSVRSGSGVLLLRRSTRDVDLAIAPGVEEKLGPIYQRLRFHEIHGAWLQKPLSHMGIAIGLARGRLGTGGRLKLRWTEPTNGVIATSAPSDDQIADLCSRMRHGAGDDGVVWSEDLIRWRYFDPQGPGHLLAICPGSAAYAVLALGMRKGVRTMRLMDFSSDGSAGWIAHVEKLARSTGAALGLAFTTDRIALAELHAAGWKPRAGKTLTFSTSATLASVSPSTTDLGFEAFNTEYG